MGLQCVAHTITRSDKKKAPFFSPHVHTQSPRATDTSHETAPSSVGNSINDRNNPSHESRRLYDSVDPTLFNFDFSCLLFTNRNI